MYCTAFTPLWDCPVWVWPLPWRGCLWGFLVVWMLSLVSQGKYSWALCLFQWFASACQWCLAFWEIRVVHYYKRCYGLCLICILGVHVFVCCLLWSWPCPHIRFCSHSNKDEKTTRVCVFHSQPLENISFLFSEQDCMGCSCISGVGGNSFGADTGDCLLVLNTDP